MRIRRLKGRTVGLTIGVFILIQFILLLQMDTPSATLTFNIANLKNMTSQWKEYLRSRPSKFRREAKYQIDKVHRRKPIPAAPHTIRFRNGTAIVTLSKPPSLSCQRKFIEFHDDMLTTSSRRVLSDYMKNECGSLHPFLDQFDTSFVDIGGLEYCSWSKEGRFKYLPKDSEISESVLEFLNSLGFVYVLKTGALLGAVRHGGLIPGDEELEIVVPIWLNRDLVGKDFCRDASTILMPTLRVSDEKEKTLCGFNRTYWTQTFKDAFSLLPSNKLEDVEILEDSHGLGVIEFRYKTMNVIASVSILDGRIPFRGPLCKCHWYTTFGICFEEAHEYLVHMFGADYMTADSSGRPVRNVNWTTNDTVQVVPRYYWYNYA